MSTSDFYQTGNLQYPEIATLLEPVTYQKNIGKFFIPILTPTLSGSSTYQANRPVVSTSNIVNKDNLGLSGYTETNYIELTVPKHLFNPIIKNHTSEKDVHHVVTYEQYPAGTKFIIVFIGGDINNIRIIGVY